MKKHLLLALALTVLHGLSAQIGHGGSPYAFGNSLITTNEIVMPYVDVEKYLLEDEQNVGTKKPFRFGAEIDTSITLHNAGTWQELPNGDRVWQLRISCREAKTMNFIFDRFFIPQGGRMFIYTPDRKYVTGAFTEQNNNPEHVFSTSLYPGSSVIMEYYEPVSVKDMGEISIATVVHGYRDIFFKTDKGNYGTSGSCNININCTEGRDWQMEKRGVALILRGGSAHCTGALINNTSNDGTPYLLTANHCVNGHNPSTFVFVFKHEAESCNGTTGPTIYSINYSSLIAKGSNSDFALLRLSDTVPRSYEPLYLGWSRTSTAPTAMTCIHHPNGDLKKISLAGAGRSSSYLDNTDDGTHWRVSRWLQGTTESGSSGSPLFNQNHQIIGQLHGGDASCSDPQGSDYYGKLYYSWNNNNAVTSSARLRDWLDPTNTGATSCPAYDPCTSSLSRDAAMSNSNIDTVYCNVSQTTPEIRITNRGNDTIRSLTIKYQFDTLSPQQYSWSGILILNAFTTITLNPITLSSGTHTLTIWCENPNGTTDQNTSNDTIVLPISVKSGKEVSYRIKLPDRYSSFMDGISNNVSWEFLRDDSTVISSHNELPSIDYSESFCTQPGCYTLRVTLSSYISRLRSEITLEGYVNGVLVRSVTAAESLRFCTNEVDIDNASKTNDFMVYPNPTNAAGRVVVEFAEAAERQYLIADTKGKICAKGSFCQERNEISIPYMSCGIYFVQVLDDKGIYVKKLIIN